MKFSQLLALSIFGLKGARAVLNQTWPLDSEIKFICREITLPINATANNAVLPSFPNATSLSAVYEFLDSINNASLASTSVSGIFNISASYCEPSIKISGRESTVQLLLHGLSYTKTYWSGINYPHPTFDHEYSWVSHALSQGYATLAIDNLGNGDSSHPDPVQVVQKPLQVEVMREIIRRLRDGSLPSIPRSYQKIVFVSHSYGSIIGRSLATVYPNDGADTYVLTGAAANLTGLQGAIASFQLQPASIIDPDRFSGLLPGYAGVSATGLRETCYSGDGDFDPNVLAWDLASPHFLAVGELATLPSEIASNFTGPVMVLTGRYDQVACGKGNIELENVDCGVEPTSNPGMMQSLFPKALRFDSYTPDYTGHDLNTHFSAPESFGVAHQWLESNGF